MVQIMFFPRNMVSEYYNLISTGLSYFYNRAMYNIQPNIRFLKHGSILYLIFALLTVKSGTFNTQSDLHNLRSPYTIYHGKDDKCTK